MRRIKFSHEYNKFFGIPSNARLKLLQIFHTTYNELSTDFIKYDTTTTKGKRYVLPKGKLMVLLFYYHEGGTIFTTVRRWTQAKENYYQNLVGEGFKLVIE